MYTAIYDKFIVKIANFQWIHNALLHFAKNLNVYFVIYTATLKFIIWNMICRI